MAPGTTREILVLPGDGIGPEITRAAVAVLEAADARFGLSLTLRRMEIGFAALDTSGTTMPDAVVAAARASDGVILGPVSHNAYPPVAEGGPNPSGVLRRELDLFANIRPARSRAGIPAPGREMDLVIVRENTEGFYADRTMYLGTGEVMPTPDLALAIRKVTRHGSRRIAEAAFDLASARPVGRVTAVHKANVLRVSDGLFLDEVRAAARDHPAIAYDEVLVDAAAAHLVRDPSRFDVIVTTNMFGDILSDLASELAGGLGLAGSLNRGAGVAVAQAQHGSAPDIAGQGIANPVSLILSVAMLLDHLGEGAAARAVSAAVGAALADPASRTRDLGGTATTDEATRAIISHLGEAA
ncbi:isocitrate/isopropylmalate dehydrogenase family protein [Rhodobacteraceae bacterium NNCM2]|nr:isocitrate/isopropylmalate dehydrogenase family protein [Coraliihabitans acroporae]